MISPKLFAACTVAVLSVAVLSVSGRRIHTSITHHDRVKEYGVVNFPTEVLWSEVAPPANGHPYTFTYYRTYRVDPISGDRQTVVHDTNGLVAFVVSRATIPEDFTDCTVQVVHAPLYQLQCGVNNLGVFVWASVGKFVPHSDALDANSAAKMAEGGLMEVDPTNLRILGNTPKCIKAQNNKTGLVWLLNTLVTSESVHVSLLFPRKGSITSFLGYSKMEFDEDTGFMTFWMSPPGRTTRYYSYIVTLSPKHNVYGWHHLGMTLAAMNDQLPAIKLQSASPLILSGFSHMLGSSRVFDVKPDNECILDLYNNNNSTMSLMGSDADATDATSAPLLISRRRTVTPSAVVGTSNDAAAAARVDTDSTANNNNNEEDCSSVEDDDSSSEDSSFEDDDDDQEGATTSDDDKPYFRR